MKGMNMVKYKDYVGEKKIKSDKKFPGKCRYVARYRLNIPQNDCSTQEKIATVILKNPSKADEKNSDQTINTVLEYMYAFQYSRVYIVNLIPVYATNSSLADRKLWHNSYIIKKNNKYIFSAICIADKVFVGWGGSLTPDPLLFREQIEYVSECLSKLDNKKMYCYLINKSNKQPRHPCRNGWRGRKPEEEFMEFHIES